jgi:hypothetical protein
VLAAELPVSSGWGCYASGPLGRVTVLEGRTSPAPWGPNLFYEAYPVFGLGRLHEAPGRATTGRREVLPADGTCRSIFGIVPAVPTGYHRPACRPSRSGFRPLLRCPGRTDMPICADLSRCTTSSVGRGRSTSYSSRRAPSRPNSSITSSRRTPRTLAPSAYSPPRTPMCSSPKTRRGRPSRDAPSCRLPKLRRASGQ